MDESAACLIEQLLMLEQHRHEDEDEGSPFGIGWMDERSEWCKNVADVFKYHKAKEPLIASSPHVQRSVCVGMLCRNVHCSTARV